MDSSDIHFTTCRPVEEHARQIMEWRNDAETRANSYHQDCLVWETFWPQYRDKYFNKPNWLYPAFVETNGERFGFFGFDAVSHPLGKEMSTVEISINLDPAKRGRGLGTLSFEASRRHLGDRGIQCIYAEIFVGNTVSIRAAKSAGFVIVDQKQKHVEDTGVTHDILVLIAKPKEHYVGV